MAIRQSTTPDTQTKLATRRSHKRDEAQTEIDGFVRTLVTEWHSADQPTEGGPTRRFDVDDKSDGKRRVNRAFSLVSKERRENKPEGAEKVTPILPTNLQPVWYADSEPDPEGWVTIKFGVGVADDQPKLNGSAPAATEGDQSEGDQSEGETQRGRRSR